MTETQKTFTLGVILQLVATIILAPFIPLIISGDWGWWQAWAFAVLYILSFAVSRILASRRHPDLIRERARFMRVKDTKPWDKTLAPLLGIGSILVPVTAGLDKYYGWSPAFSLIVNLLALFGILLSYGVSSWALIENRFFSSTVRIQTERGHHVVSTGPYRIIRHPGYAGGLFSYICVPLLLDSIWAWIPTVFLMTVMVIRTALEDKTLQAELSGYKEFTQKTRYRLIPGIW